MRVTNEEIIEAIEKTDRPFVADLCHDLKEARERVRVLTEALLDIAHPKMETRMGPGEIALRVLNAR
jgi:hypothetical protein